MQSIGIFSGTFNPVHDGHIAFALEALTVCHLDKVVFMPEQSPRHKENPPDIAVRAAQLRQKISEYPQLEILILDQARFTVHETLPELHRLFGNVHLTLLLGSDVARGLADWPDIAELAADVSFAVGLRKDDTSEECEEIKRRIESKTGIPLDIAYIRTDFSHLSSSQLR
jgi:nicotinate-nucleotide adenylyltransferase